MNVRVILALIVLAVLATFVFMNLEKATVWIFGVRAEMPIALLVFVCGALGLIAGMLLAYVGKSKRKPDKKPAA